MKSTLLAALILVSYASIATASLTFTITPTSQSVPQGSNVIFDLYVASSVDGQNVAGVDLGVTAGDGATNGTFTAGTTAILGGTAPFLTGGTAFLSTNLVGGQTINTTPVQLGSLTLDTAGVSPGTYQTSFDIGSLFAVNSASLPIATFDGNAGGFVSYTITAVPEPTSLLAGATLGFFGVMYRRRRARA